MFVFDKLSELFALSELSALAALSIFSIFSALSPLCVLKVGEKIEIWSKLFWRACQNHSEVVKHVSFIPHICHGLTDGVCGEKNLSCGEMSNYT